MTSESWHTDFNPSKFLSRVNLTQLLERNEAFNESVISNAKTACILCGSNSHSGIILNDKSFLCQKCYAQLTTVSYPERYESLRRQHVVAVESRRLALEEFYQKYEYKSDESLLVILGWASVLLAFAVPVLFILSAILLGIGYQKNSENKRKTDEWLHKKAKWEQLNPFPSEPVLKHFHDPSAILSAHDKIVLKVFNHWPGYPPFWKYLRTVVTSRDSNRCQVTGCPSRLGLHVHHMRAVADGGPHSPDNLITLCDFHHALEPDKGHERIWGDIKTRYFTLVCSHERSNRTDGGHHYVRAHLRRLQLITLEDLRSLTQTYGYCCPECNETKIKFILNTGSNTVRVECHRCGKASEGPQQLAEETGPLLAEVLAVTRNKGKWKARWDMLAERKGATWGVWSGAGVTEKRKQHRAKVETASAPPSCPKCGAAMKLVKPRQSDKWKPFWGCSNYPITGCKGSVRVLKN